MLIHFNTKLQITTVHCLEGAVVPNLIDSHTVSRVPGLTPSSVMHSESQGFQGKSYSFVRKELCTLQETENFSESTREMKCRTIAHTKEKILGSGHYMFAYSCQLNVPLHPSTHPPQKKPFESSNH